MGLKAPRRAPSRRRRRLRDCRSRSSISSTWASQGSPRICSACARRPKRFARRKRWRTDSKESPVGAGVRLVGVLLVIWTFIRALPGELLVITEVVRTYGECAYARIIGERDRDR